MTVREFEDAVRAKEGFRIVVRASSAEEVDDWTFENAAKGNYRVTQWLRNRVRPRLRGHEVVVIDGYGETPHGRTHVGTLRESFRGTGGS